MALQVVGAPGEAPCSFEEASEGGSGTDTREPSVGDTRSLRCGRHLGSGCPNSLERLIFTLSSGSQPHSLSSSLWQNYARLRETCSFLHTLCYHEIRVDIITGVEIRLAEG